MLLEKWNCEQIGRRGFQFTVYRVADMSFLVFTEKIERLKICRHHSFSWSDRKSCDGEVEGIESRIRLRLSLSSFDD